MGQVPFNVLLAAIVVIIFIASTGLASIKANKPLPERYSYSKRPLTMRNETATGLEFIKRWVISYAAEI